MKPSPTIIAAIVAITIGAYATTTHIIKKSEDRFRSTILVGRAISILMSESDTEMPQRISCIRKRPNLFNYIYQIAPIITIYDFKGKSGDYEYSIVLPVQYINDNKLRTTLQLLASSDSPLKPVDDIAKLKTGNALLYIDIFRSEYLRGQNSDTMSIKIEYTPCDKQSQGCEECTTLQPDYTEILTINNVK